MREKIRGFNEENMRRNEVTDFCHNIMSYVKVPLAGWGNKKLIAPTAEAISKMINQVEFLSAVGGANVSIQHPIGHHP